jgi:hypothetical protein
MSRHEQIWRTMVAGGVVVLAITVALIIVAV